jgi:predicted phage terminase large subunit-like protein
MNYYILDGIRDRLNLTERTEKLMDLVRKWRPQATFYEEYGMQADIQHIREEQERSQFRFRLIAIGGPMPKVDRIKRLVPTMQQGSLWVPETMMRQCADGHQRDIIKELVDEMLAFPVGANDDALDNLARIHEEEVQKYLKPPQAAARAAPVIPFTPFDAEIGY